MLEPRRIATRSAAFRMASLLNESPGQTVGYRMRLESKIGSRTQIEIITEGILTRMLQQDPALEDVGLVIFDEFHERNLDSDLALALCLQGRALFRGKAEDGNPALKILVMSATLDSMTIAQLLQDAVRWSSGGLLGIAELCIIFRGTGKRTKWSEKESERTNGKGATKNCLSLSSFW